MIRRVGALACAVVGFACDHATESSSEAGGVVLNVVTNAGGSQVLDSGRVHVVGPTTRVVPATPGNAVTVDQLEPGSYSVSLQGFASDDVERFGRATGVQVVAGQNTAATVTFNVFQPVLAPFAPDTNVGQELTVVFPAVTNAASYELELAAEETFATVLETETAATPSVPVTLPDFGDFFVRVRAVDPFDGRGVPSTARLIRSVKPIVTLLSCGFQPGGDGIDRGFHVPSFPGSALSQVDLFFSTSIAGDYTLSLTAFAGTYDGPIIGTSSATVALTADVLANVQTAFLFPSPPVTPGSTVAFRVGLTGGAGGSVFYALGLTDPDCAQIVETEGTSPPLSTPRGGGRPMGAIIQGRAP